MPKEAASFNDQFVGRFFAKHFSSMVALEELYSIFRQHPLVCTDTRQLTPGCLFFALNSLNTAARHPDRVATAVMITSVVRLLDLALTVNGATELSTPNDQRVIQ